MEPPGPAQMVKIIDSLDYNDLFTERSEFSSAEE